MKGLLVKYLMFFILMFAFQGVAQKRKLNRAKEQYEKYQYVDAIATYLEVAKKGYESPDLFKDLGNSYYFNSEFTEAGKWYAKLFEKYPENIEPEYYFRYAQTLKSNKEYDKADELLRQFTALSSTDKRGALFQEEMTYLERIYYQSGRYDIENLEINSEFTDFGVAFYGDKAVFASSRDTLIVKKDLYQWSNEAFLDLYSSDIDYTTGVLSNSEKFDEVINSKFHESTPVFTKDGNTMYFSRNNFDNKRYGSDRQGNNRLKIYVSYKTTEGWSDPQSLPFTSDEYSTAHPALNLEENQLYFSSDMPGGYGQSDIYKVEIFDNGSFGIPENMGNSVNTEGKETFPFISAKNDLYFSSDGHMGLGGMDVFIHGLNPDLWYQGLAINVGEPINGPNDDFAFVINEETRRGYFSSNRVGGKGKDDIYGFLQTEDLREFADTFIAGVVKDVETGEPIPGATVLIMDSDRNILEKLVANEDGTYQSKFKTRRNSNYIVAISKDGYQPAESMVTTPNRPGPLDLSDNKELQLLRLANIADVSTKSVTMEGSIMDCETYITGVVKDAQTSSTIEGATVTILDANYNTIETIQADQNGRYRSSAQIDCDTPYFVRISKPDYRTTELLVTTPNTSGPLDLTDLKELRLIREIRTIGVGDDLSKVLNLNPIYFDFNDYLIRDDAKVELAKVIEVLQKYPNLKIEIRSHTDSRADEDYNYKLSRRRAVKTANYIAIIGEISRDRLFSKGFGEQELLNGCNTDADCTEEEHQLNRRSEFIIVEQ